MSSKLIGGLSPAAPGDPRTFPAFFNENSFVHDGDLQAGDLVIVSEGVDGGPLRLTKNFNIYVESDDESVLNVVEVAELPVSPVATTLYLIPEPEGS